MLSNHTSEKLSELYNSLNLNKIRIVFFEIFMHQFIYNKNSFAFGNENDNSGTMGWFLKLELIN